jgi:two-component system OmpR family sensor kinase
LKTYEVESFLKSFLIFFVLLEILLAINFWHEYQVKKLEIEEKIQVEMKLCAYTIQCEGLQTDFVDKSKEKEENILYKDGDFYSYFSVPTAEKYLMKVVYPKTKYLARLEKLEETLRHKFFLYSLFAALVSLLFSVYALMPLHRALRLNEEFVKDILHDFNTPLSSMQINLKLFKREIGENTKINRLENNIETILSLQHNLQTFLRGTLTQVEVFDINPLIKERVPYFELLYPDVAYRIDVIPFRIKANRDAFARILDNLLSNAGKYNKKSGQVSVRIDGTLLSIEDTGKGITEPAKVFRRYYKEQDRGIGIGLHIVKKLCDEMHIDIRIKSKKDQGTRIFLDLSRVMA